MHCKGANACAPAARAGRHARTWPHTHLAGPRPHLAPIHHPWDSPVSPKGAEQYAGGCHSCTSNATPTVVALALRCVRGACMQPCAGMGALRGRAGDSSAQVAFLEAYNVPVVTQRTAVLFKRPCRCCHESHLHGRAVG